jgi:hypothetical protein
MAAVTGASRCTPCSGEVAAGKRSGVARAAFVGVGEVEDRRHYPGSE